MKLTVGNKLFFGVLFVTLIVIALIVGMASWSLRQGFSNYLTQTELNRQELVVKRLQEVYAARGDWSLFKDKPEAWLNFVETTLAQEQKESLSPVGAGQTSGGQHLVGQATILRLQTLVLSSADSPAFLPIEIAQFSGGGGPGPRMDAQRPPPNAFQECRGKSEGDQVMHRTPDGLVRSVCMYSPEGLVARPARPELSQRLAPESPAESTAPNKPPPARVPTPAQPKPATVQKNTSPGLPATTPAATPSTTPGSSPTVPPSPSPESGANQPVQKVSSSSELERPLLMLARRFTLMDRNGEMIAGVRVVPPENIVSRPLTHEGKIVGQLGMVVAATSSVIDQAFIDHSLRMLLIVAGVALLLSVLASLLMAHHLKTILRKVTIATRRLASGEYGMRIEGERHDEFGDLVRDFNRLAHALEQHENNRRLWVAQTSHELRTPVSILRAHIEALLDGVRAPGPKEFEVLLKETMRLAKLITDLNDLARADSGALAFQKKSVDLTGLIAEMVDSFSDRFALQGIRVHMDLSGPLYVFGDASRLRQLCANLFENSLRYTDAGGEISIVVTQHDNAIEWTTEDSAPGVESTVLASLFDPFFRTDQSRHRETGGSGLGLAICKSIVSAHEGSIHAYHSDLGGLKLKITLPLLETKK